MQPSRPFIHLTCWALLSACSGAGENTAPARSLEATAALPVQYASNTRLRLGDPQVQKLLELSGELPERPFELEWHNLTGGPQTLEAFRAQALDGGNVGDTPPIHAAFTGVPVKIISVIERTQPTMRLALAPSSGIRELSDLRGKRIAYSPGQAQGALIARVLRKLKLEAADVRLVELSSSEFKDALSSGQVDVAPLGGPQLVRYLNEQGPRGARALDHGVRDNLSFFYVRESVLRDPDKAAALRAYVAARTRAQLWAAAHPERWLRAYFVAEQHLSLEEGRSLLQELRYPGDWSEAIALTQETADLLASASGQAPVDAARLFDRRFEAVSAEASRLYRARAGLPEVRP